MRIIFTPPTENEFKQIFLSTPLRKGGGFEDISIYTPKTIPYRRGSGILSFISGVAKRVLPMLVKAAKPAAKEFGKNMINDIIQKKSLRKSLKRNGIHALKQTGIKLMKGSGKKKINRKRKISKKKNTRRRRYKSDIFDFI